MAAELNTPDARRGLSIAQERLADIAHDQGDTSGAKALYQKCFTIREALAAELNTPEAHRDLSETTTKLAQRGIRLNE